MKISVIIPAHNSALFIEKCIDSIKSQTFTDYEIIVVCDACEDNTVEVVKPLVDKVAQVNFHNDGLTRNAGLALAEGEYVLFIDHDDWYERDDAFEIMMREIEDYDILCFGFYWNGIGHVGPRSGRGPLYPHVWNKLWRRAFIGDTRFKPIFAESDRVFNDEVLIRLPEIKEINDMLVYYNFLKEGSVSYEMGRRVEDAVNYWGITPIE